MKYSEFKKLMEDKGFFTEDSKNSVYVYTLNERPIAVVFRKCEGLIDLSWDSYIELPVETRKFIADNCMELSFTPPKDREEEEVLYYLRQIGVGSWNFLNFNINSQEYNVAGKKDDFTYKTQFTQSEIDDMPECYTHPAVWEKIKVDREWSEMD